MVSAWIIAAIVVASVIVLILLLGIGLKIYATLTCGIYKSRRRLVGKVVIVTGGNTGIGFETAKDLAERGARVILGCRNKTKGTAAVESIIASTGNNDVHFRQLDLTSLTSVRTFADEIIKTERRLDILINNAGIYLSEYAKTEDGLLLAMQSNHFGPFLLTSLLLPLIKSSAPSRIINVSSIGHLRGKIDFENLNSEKETEKSYSQQQVYVNSKLCNVLMAAELARRLEGTGVTTYSLHPGAVATDIVANLKSSARYLMPVLNIFLKTPWEGAQTTIYTAVAPELEGVTGKYYSDCKEVKPAKLAKDKEVARKLWEVSEKLVGLKQ